MKIMFVLVLGVLMGLSVNRAPSVSHSYNKLPSISKHPIALRGLDYLVTSLKGQTISPESLRHKLV